MSKRLRVVSGMAAMFLACALTSWAADQEVTLTGEGKCGKCALKETKECQNVIQVEKEGKKVTYYIAQNEVSKKFHSELCQATKKIQVTGTVKEVDGKKELTAKKIELVKETKS